MESHKLDSYKVSEKDYLMIAVCLARYKFKLKQQYPLLVAKNINANMQEFMAENFADSVLGDQSSIKL